MYIYIYNTSFNKQQNCLFVCIYMYERGGGGDNKHFMYIPGEGVYIL